MMDRVRSIGMTLCSTQTKKATRSVTYDSNYCVRFGHETNLLIRAVFRRNFTPISRQL